jgi:hypothetical protein
VIRQPVRRRLRGPSDELPPHDHTSGIIRGGGTVRVTTDRTPGSAPRITADSNLRHGIRGEVPELRAKTIFPVQLRLGEFARKVIRNDLYCLARSDGRESGGWLFGRPWKRRDEIIDVREATDSGDAVRRAQLVARG